MPIEDLLILGGYALLLIKVFLWVCGPYEALFPQRQTFWYEDLRQMQWERCTLTMLPRLGLLIVIIVVPPLVTLEYLAFDGTNWFFKETPHVAWLLVWIARIVAVPLLLVAATAVVGWLYYRLYRREDHERRFQKLLDETLITNAAYGLRHSDRQIMMIRPTPGTLSIRRRTAKFGER
ncbi:hypothetical protein [Rhizobium ruizarguesonis]|uniref:hypothetical protein n=1 Tax=Rhizobium ruizarguesonis TaxID=2081791 RepID=UPI0010306013|nr:hypothetical protein [Rhizobium ruizarguesonis]TAT70009.1 hypothetical protein ELI52_38490 [Rhizobium ruizarguesonis]